MSSIVLTKILFFFLFVATAIYWISSYSDKDNIIYKVPRYYRYSYSLGLIVIMVASLQVFLLKKANETEIMKHINMFLIGGVVVMISVALWDKNIKKLNNKDEI